MSRLAPYGASEERDQRSIQIGVFSGKASGMARQYLVALLAAAVGLQTVLLLISLVPATIWTDMGQSADGPIPHSLYWLTAGLFYALPAVTGALCRRWQVAVVLATLPAFVDQGVFAVAAASRLGPFYVAQGTNAADTVGTLELFAALGALGWLARTGFLLLRSDRTQGAQTRPTERGR